MTEAPLKEVCLNEGLTLIFHDCSNRYYGDYHRVLIEIDARIETAERKVCLRYRHPLKKMGVSGHEADRVKGELIAQFLTTVGPYMQKADFIEKLLRTLARPGQKVWCALR